MQYSAALLWLLTILAVSDFTAAQIPTQPNIIFILADDLGWRDVGYAGAEFFETPHIDRLAKQGMIFTAAYAAGANCAPSRACLMSGTYTPRHHIYTPGGESKGNTDYMRLLVPARGHQLITDKMWAADQFNSVTSLDPDFICIPEVLKRVGYTSARLGKWHLGRDTQGFDLSTADGIGKPRGIHYGDINVAEQLTDRAVQFIEDNKQGPFFLYLSHWDVHVPHNARPDIVDKYRQKRNNLPQSQRPPFRPVYAAMIEAVDTSVGRVMAKLDELGISENTIVIFASDNGGYEPVSQLAPLRGTKGSLFEAGVRVPTCIRWPAVISPGTTCDTPITSVDFLPTFSRLAAAPLPQSQPVDGVDLTPLFQMQPIAERSIFWHFPLYLNDKTDSNTLRFSIPGGDTIKWRAVPSTSMRRGDWKLIEYHEDDSVVLYNLKDDPGEENDLSQKLPDVTVKLRRELDQWQMDTRAPIPTVLNPSFISD